MDGITKGTTMERIANKKAREYVERLKEFKGSNLKGVWIDGFIYAIYSYSTPVMVFNGHTRQWLETDQWYSVTTTKQMTQCRTYSYVNALRISQDNINYLVSKAERSA